MGMMVEDKIIFKKVSEVRPYIRNPRKNDKTVELLCELIPKVGFNVPIVIDEKGIIVKGHARYTAAIRLGMTEIPCIISHADEDAIRLDRITDNKISEFSEWINDEVLQEIESINTDFDFSDLGFPVVRFDGIPIEGAQMPSEAISGEKAGISMDGYEKPVKTPIKYYKCVCAECGHVQFVKEDDLK